MASLLLHQPPKIPSQEAEVSEGRWESHPYASLYDQVLSAHPDAVVSNASMTPNSNSNSKTGPAIPAVITSMGFPSPNIIALPMRDDSPAVVPPSSSASSTSETDSSYDDDDDDDDDDEEEEDDDVIALLRNGNLDIHHLELDDDDDEDDDDAISVHTIDSMETIDFVPSCAKSSELHVVGSSYPSSEDASTSIYPKKRARPNESLATTVSTINTSTTTTSQPKKTPSSFDAALLPPMKKFKAVSSSSSCVPTTTNLNLHGNFEMKLMMEARQHQYKQMVEALERRKCMFASMRLRLEQEELQTNLRQKQFLLCLLRQENERLLEMKKAMKGEKKPKKKGSLDATRSSSSPSSSIKARKSKKNDARWMTMFERLKVYKKHHGNTLVPVRYKDRQLGEWVRQQRRRCKRPERTKMLEDIGFVFIVRPNQGHWFDMYQKLVDYKKTHNGYTNVPMGDKNYPELAEWVSRQRMLYRHWGISRHRRDLLERIGFKLTDNTK